jgi:hypothetical protein
MFGYKNHLGIDRRHGIIRSFAVSDAARHYGRQLGRLLNPPQHREHRLGRQRLPLGGQQPARRRLVAQLQRPKPRRKPMPPHLARGNANRARARVAIEHVFAAQKCRLGLIIRSAGVARATARLGLANLVTQRGPPGLVRDPRGAGLRPPRPGSARHRARRRQRAPPPTPTAPITVASRSKIPDSSRCPVVAGPVMREPLPATP